MTALITIGTFEAIVLRFRNSMPESFILVVSKTLLLRTVEFMGLLICKEKIRQIEMCHKSKQEFSQKIEVSKSLQN